VTDTKLEKLIAEMEAIIDDTLHGIDLDSTESDDGWWETSKGVTLGASRKALLKDRLRALIEGRG